MQVTSKWLGVGAFFLFFIGAEQTAAQEELSIDLDFSLDQVSDRPLRLEVSVRNHGFVVIPPVTIIRPILSSVSQTTMIRANQSSVSLTISGISPEAVDYTIRFRCLNCADSLPTQYYLERDGVVRTSRGLVNDAYIDPAELSSLAAVELETFGYVEGAISLSSERFSSRSPVATVALIDIDSGREASSTKVPLVLGATAPFRLDRLDRRFVDAYRLRIRCGACDPRQLSFGQPLSADLNHSGLDFSFGLGAPHNASSLFLLLEDD